MQNVETIFTKVPNCFHTKRKAFPTRYWFQIEVYSIGGSSVGTVLVSENIHRRTELRGLKGFRNPGILMRRRSGGFFKTYPNYKIALQFLWGKGIVDQSYPFDIPTLSWTRKRTFYFNLAKVSFASAAPGNFWSNSRALFSSLPAYSLSPFL